MRGLMAVLLLAAAANPAIEYDHEVDFSRYQTWTWDEKVTHAMDATTDNRIREAIESGLTAHGLSRVDKNAALLVAYHASKTSQVDLTPVGKGASSSNTGIQYTEKGA